MDNFDKHSFFCHEGGMPQPSHELKEALHFLGEQLHFPLFPLKGRSYTPEGHKSKNENQKTPWRTGWQSMASSDPVRLSLWVAQGAWAFGVHTGKPLPGGGYLTVVDCDIAKKAGALNGIDYFKELYEKNEMSFPDDMLSSFTPSGGQHFYFRSQTCLKNEVRKTIPEVDIRGKGGIIVAPGSRLLMNDNLSIKTYRAARPFPEMKLYDMPEWLENLISQRQAENIKEPVEKKDKQKKSSVILLPDTNENHNVKTNDLFTLLKEELSLKCQSNQSEAILSKCKEWCESLEKAVEGERNSILFGTTVRLARLVPQFISLQLCRDLAKESALICQRNTQGDKPFPTSEIDITISSAIDYRYRKGSGMSFSLTTPEPLSEKESQNFEQILMEKKEIARKKLFEQQKQHFKKRVVKF